MKSLKKLALTSTIAAISAGAQAELKALDDSAMGELTGQRGITIDLETKYEIGEFVYRDAGSLVIEGIRLGAHETDNAGSALLDNIRMTIDIAGSGAPDPDTGAPDNVLTYGFAEVIGLTKIYAANGNANAEFLALADADGDGISNDITRNDEVTGAALEVDQARTYGDGDLVIHFGFNDPWEKSAQGSFAAYAADPSNPFTNETYAAAEDIALRAADFRFEIDAIGLASSDYVIGTQAAESDDPFSIDGGATQTTTLISDLSIQGYLGPQDLHIENDGNGVGNEAGEAGALGAGISGKADSKITWGSYVNITDMDVTIDIAGVTLEDIQIHNRRGDLSTLDGTSSFGFAHSIRTIYRVENDVLNLAGIGTPDVYTDGLALNSQFKGDIDIGAISFGDDSRSIGELFLTDIQSTTNWTLSAH